MTVFKVTIATEVPLTRHPFSPGLVLGWQLGMLWDGKKTGSTIPIFSVFFLVGLKPIRCIWVVYDIALLTLPR